VGGCSETEKSLRPSGSFLLLNMFFRCGDVGEEFRRRSFRAERGQVCESGGVVEMAEIGVLSGVML
jgi:hypothetical protein